MEKYPSYMGLLATFWNLLQIPRSTLEGIGHECFQRSHNICSQICTRCGGVVRRHTRLPTASCCQPASQALGCESDK